MEEQPENPNESILKPKAKRTLTDEQRLALAQRMRAINDKRIADAMAKKEKASLPVQEAPVETPKVEKNKKRIVKVIEISEPESESESEEEIIIVPKKKVVKAAQSKPEVKPKAKPVARRQKAQPVYEESEEEQEAPQRISKPKPKKPEPVQEAPKILYRFL